MARDYYEVLGVPKDADAAAIKKAYKAAARKHHPDLNQGNAEAEPLFKEAAEAYDVLASDDKRRIYDQYGHEGLKGRGYDPNFTDVSDIFSVFGDLFGGAFGNMFSGGRRAGPQRGGDVEVAVPLTFLEAALGVTKNLTVPRLAHCEGCKGRGLRDGAKQATCATCAGHGQVLQVQGFLRIRTTCPTCRGAGQSVAVEDRCTKCRGSGRTRSTIDVEVRIPGGAYAGLQIRHPGKGDLGDPGAGPGDLYLTLDVEPHEVFKREGADVYVTIPVPYPLMCLGGAVTVPTVHGEETVTVVAGTPSGHVETLVGKGCDHLRARSQRGDHHVRFTVDVPKAMGEAEDTLVRQLAELRKLDIPAKGFWGRLFG